MGKKTALYQQHIAAGGKMVDFVGWDMPIHYGSQIDEHHCVRQEVGVFDVSHMAIIDVKGADSKAYLRYVLANDVTKLNEPGKALYTCMLNEQGGIIDDLIVYFMAEDFYRLVVNAGTCEKDWAWLSKQALAFQVSLQIRADLAILAIQGPQARQKINLLMPPEYLSKLERLKSFQFLLLQDWLIARTGYTGEDGYEIMLPNEQVVNFWQAILNAGVKPCGLGARDTLRLEAGLSLYGSDMDESTTPLESNLAWTVALEPVERNFIGRFSLMEQQRQGIGHKLVGLILIERGVLRSHQRVILADGSIGETTSGTFSPTLNKGIALARVPAAITNTCQIQMRDKLVAAHVVKPLFIRQGFPTQQINSILNSDIAKENL